MDYVKHFVQEAGGNFSQRDQRVFSRLFAKCVDAATNNILHSAFEKYLEKQDTIITKQSTSDLVPDLTLSTGEEQGVVVTPVSRFAKSSRTIIFTDDNGGEVVEPEDELEDEDTTNTTTNSFLSELKEDGLLQSLLTRRLFEKKERVFELKHQNGKPLLVVLPPDTKSVATFKDDSEWVDQLLFNEERVEGMLLHLAKTSPETYLKVGTRRRLSMKVVTLDTAQTMALASRST